MADVKWIKIVTDIFDDQKIRFIETMPNGDGIIVIWFKLLCLAGKSNAGGFLMLTDKIAYTEDMLASIFCRDKKLIELALNTFVLLDMIEIVDNKIYLTNWEKHQNIEGMDKIRAQTRERVARYRERQKRLPAPDEMPEVTPDVTPDVTLRNATDIDIEIEKDIDIKNNNNSDKPIAKRPRDIFKEFAADNATLLQALRDFDEMRKKIKKPMTDRAKQMLVNKLEKMSADPVRQVAILEQSIMHAWQDIYELKGDNMSLDLSRYNSPEPTMNAAERLRNRLRKMGVTPDGLNT